MKKKKIVCFDFDGVIHSYKSGWKGVSTIPDEPIEGIRESINEIRKDYLVYVFSSRCSTPDGVYAITYWLNEHDIVVDDVVSKKPPAYVTIDDRCIRFNGNTKGLKDLIDNYKTWQKE